MKTTLQLFLALLSVFLSVPASAGSGPTPALPTNLVKETVTQPDGGSTWLYVDPRGSDTNTCSTAFTDGGFDGPCATPQGATNKIPKLIRGSGVVVVVAGQPDAGSANYPCLYVSGFDCDPGAKTALTGGLLYDGTLVLDAVATGLNSGTSTAGTAGSGVAFGTMTDALQAWTVDDLVGRLVTIDTGPSAGTTRPIVSNTATVLTIAGNWTAPTASGYRIVKPSWNLTTACATPPSGAAAATANQASIYAFGNNCSYRAGAITFRNVGVTTAAGSAFQTSDGSSYGFTNFKIATTAGTGFSSIIGSTARLTVASGSFTGATSTFMASSTSPVTYSINNAMTYGANAGMVTFNPGQVAPLLSVAGCEVKNATTAGFALNGVTSTRNLIQTTKIACASSAGLGVILGQSGATLTLNNGYGGGSLTVTQSSVATCGIGFLAAGPNSYLSLDQITGSAATNAAMANWGGQVIAVTGVTATGGVQDYNLDNGVAANTWASIGAGTCANTSAVGYGSRICK